MRTISANEPTRYEVAAVHQDGRQFLICYAAGSPSIAALFRVVRDRIVPIADGCGWIDRQATVIERGSNPRPFLRTDSGWSLRYTGRTQRDVRAAGSELSYVGAR